MSTKKFEDDYIVTKKLKKMKLDKGYELSIEKILEKKKKL
jgi:hypothetical protein